MFCSESAQKNVYSNVGSKDTTGQTQTLNVYDFQVWNKILKRAPKKQYYKVSIINL